MVSTQVPSPKVPRKLYFAYGSNLWLAQMLSRCPSSTLHTPCLAKLRGYRWVICERGYANVVHKFATTRLRDCNSKSQALEDPEDVVYGLLYELTPLDETSLDEAEGVAFRCYDKKMLEVEYVVDEVGQVSLENESGEETGRSVTALVYVDPNEGTGICKKEYVGRINNGVKDAVGRGMPIWWVKRDIGKWLPLEE